MERTLALMAEGKLAGCYGENTDINGRGANWQDVVEKILALIAEGKLAGLYGENTGIMSGKGANSQDVVERRSKPYAALSHPE